MCVCVCVCVSSSHYILTPPQGFKGHRLHPVLEAPGSADLTADVDFSYLRKMAARRGVACLGPLPQRDFLRNMGVDTRMQVGGIGDVTGHMIWVT